MSIRTRLRLFLTRAMTDLEVWVCGIQLRLDEKCRQEGHAKIKRGICQRCCREPGDPALWGWHAARVPRDH